MEKESIMEKYKRIYRHGDDTGDDTGHAAGGGNGDHALTASGEGFPDHLEEGEQLCLEAIGPGFFIQQAAEGADGDGHHDGDGGGVLDGLLAGGYQIHQQDQGQQQVNLLQQGHQSGQLPLGQAPQALLLGLQVDGDEDTGEVQHRGQDSLHGDGGIGQLDEVRHQEGGGAHDGGHDLAAGGGGGLSGRGELGLVAGLLHQGDGDGAGANGIGNAGAGDHALKSGGHHGHLCGAAGEAADNSIGDVDEELTDAGALQEGTEDDEHHDELAADIDGGGEDAFLGEEQLAHHTGDPAAEGRIGQAPDQGIDHEAARHDQDGQAHAPAADLAQGQDAHDADGHLIGLELAALHDDGLGVEGEVEEGGGAQHHDKGVIPGEGVDLLMALLCREHQETDQDDPGHEGGEPDFLQPAGEEGHIQAEQGEHCQHAGDDYLGLAFPDTGIGLPVVFFHNSFQVHGLLDSGGLFLEECHENTSWGKEWIIDN